MERQYTAFCDNGRDYFSFEFYSDHRANSKSNINDAIDFWKRKQGYKAKIKVLKTVCNKYEIL